MTRQQHLTAPRARVARQTLAVRPWIMAAFGLKVFAALLLAVALWRPVAAATPESFVDLAEKALPSVVNISTVSTIEVDSGSRTFPNLPPGSPLEEFFRRFDRSQPDNDDDDDEPIERQSRSLGSGFIIDEEGIVITNNHVIDDADEITVRLNDGSEYDAKVLGRDPQQDIAVLKIESDDKFPALTWGDSDTMKVGEWVMAIGNPFGLGGSVTAGIVSALHRDIRVGNYDYFIQTDASINRGNSGGPLFNLDGEIIGVNTAIFSPTGGNVGIGFAIPANDAKQVVDQLREYGRVRRGWLGVRIQGITDETAESLGLDDTDGTLVASVNPDSPADRGGIRPGDIIRDFNGKPIKDVRELPRIVAQTPIGDTVPVKVLRDGALKTLRIKIGELPDPDVMAEAEEEPETDEAQEESTSLLGMDLQVLTSDVRERFGLSDDVEGLVIVDLKRNSNAAQKGLRPGDVISKVSQASVTSIADMQAQLASAEEANRSSVLLWVHRGGDYLFVAVKIGQS